MKARRADGGVRRAGRAAREPYARLSYRAGIAVLALCSALAVLLAEQAVAPFTALALTGATLAAALLSLLPRRTAQRGLVPHGLIVAASLGAFSWGVYEIAARGAPTVLALAHFFILIVVIKLLDRDAARDNAELLVTSLFLIVIGAIISAHLAYAVVLLAYLCVATRVLVAFGLKSEDERIAALGGAGGAGGAQGPALVFAARAAPGDAAPGLPFATLGLALAVGGLFFVVCPRVGAGMFGQLDTRVAMAVTGFTENVGFGEMTEIKKSDRPVMRVELLLNGASIGSPNVQPYFRGMTYDLYDGRRWHKLADSATYRVPDDEPAIVNYVPGPRDRLLEQRVRLLSPGTRALFACYLPYRVSTDTGRTVLMRTSDRTLLLDASARLRPMSYTVFSLTRITPELAAMLNPPQGDLPPWARRPAHQYTGRSGHFDPARVVSKAVRDYADRLVADLELPNDAASIRAVARRIESHLTSGAFAYTLERDDVNPSREPIEDFLLYRKRGHCEYFAAAMTVLCQLAGLNARMVNGYRGGEWNASGQYYIVREEHAHSWVEVHTGEGDWELFDPTPGSVNVSPERDSMWRMLSGLLDHVDAMWTEGVVAYDATSRENLLAQFGHWLAEWGQHGNVGGELLYALREVALGPTALDWGYRAMYWLLILLIGLALYMVVRMTARPVRRGVRRLVRRLAPRRRRGRREGFYARALEVLAELGYRKPPGDTPLEFMRRLAGLRPGFAALPEVAQAFYRVHFGGQALDAAGRRRIERIIAGLARPSPPR